MGNECMQDIPNNSFQQSAIIDFQEEMPRFRGKFNFQKQSAYNKIDYAARTFCQENEIGEKYSKVISLLLAYGHHHYFAAFKSIPRQFRMKFVEDISELQIELMDSLYNHLVVRKKSSMSRPVSQKPISLRVPTCLRYESLSTDNLLSSEELGLRLLMQRKVTVMIMVSGREEMNGFTSKALDNLSIAGSPTRIEFMLKKLHSILSRNSGKGNINKTVSTTSSEELVRTNTTIIQNLIIVCNTSNQLAIYSYFKQKGWFGFDERFVKITSIKDIPILNEEGKLCLSFQKKTITNPQGSSKCLQLLLDPNHHLRTFLKNNKTQFIHVLDCENEFECPGDPIFVGIAKKFQMLILAKCTPPSSTFDDRKRYLQSENQLNLMSVKEIEQLSDITLLKSGPVALNSMIFQVDWLLELTNNYEVEIVLSQRYHPTVINHNYYDFIQDRPVIGGRCYVFEKDIRDYICASPKAQLIEYNPYSLKSAY